jgi:hypothetical protein
MNEPSEPKLEISKQTRILIRDRTSTFISHVITNIQLAGDDHGIVLDESNFVTDLSDDFDKNLLLECSGALLHNMSPTDMIRLVNFLKVYPDKAKTIVLEGVYATTEEHRKLYSILRAMGIRILFRPIIESKNFNLRVLGIEG